jgi:hypothetical protein
MPGARCTRSLVCKVLVAHECSHHGRTGTPGIPARNGFSGVASANLTPASRRQDHTTSPSAKRRSRQQRHPRPPHPAPRP